jgi:hypothetical protein
MTGTFSASCFHAWGCILRPYLVPKANSGKIDSRALLRVVPTGTSLQYEMVFGENSQGFPELLYFKDDKIEFDATTTAACNYDGYLHGATLLFPKGRYDIFPSCGKITTPDGRSYEGMFKQGKPM